MQNGTPSLTLNNANLLDVRQGKFAGAKNVFIEYGRIREVSSLPVTKGKKVIDLNGATLMPGLCDAHVHVTAATACFNELVRWSPMYITARAGHILSDMLMRGFTTVRDVGGADYGLAKSVKEGYLAGPRLLHCGYALSQTGGHGDMRDINLSDSSLASGAGIGRVADGVSDVRKACRDELHKGAHFIKIMASGGVTSAGGDICSTQYSTEEIEAAVEEADAANTYVSAHAYAPHAANRALNCGVRSIEHGNFIDDSTIDLLLKKNAFLVPTMGSLEAIATEGVAGGMKKERCDRVFKIIRAGYKTYAHAQSRGVKFVFGTDLLGSMHRHQLAEFKIRSSFQKPAEIIRSATVTAAELFRMQGEIGEIVPGAFADVIALDGNPLEDLSVLQDPERNLKLICKEGVLYRNRIGSDFPEHLPPIPNSDDYVYAQSH